MQPEPGASKDTAPEKKPDTYTDNQLENTESSIGKKTFHVGMVEEPPRLLVDAHMHIMSSRCAPLPCAQGQVPFLGTVLGLRRSLLENIGKLAGAAVDLVTLKPLEGLINQASGEAPGLDGKYYEEFEARKGITVSQNTTQGVGTEFLARIDEVQKLFRGQAPYTVASGLECCAVTMTMDMEYAHLAGYFGLKIYNAVYANEADMQKGGEPKSYWYPKRGFWQRRGNEYVPVERGAELLPEAGDTETQFEARKKTMKSQGLPGTVYGTKELANGQVEVTVESSVAVHCLPCEAPNEETKLYERWDTQLKGTELAMCEGKLKLLPMFHYDPRRWQSRGNSEPFAKVSGDGLYLGFKMYTAQGYRPMDSRLPILESFYKTCASEQIPILNHCSPGGATTYDMKEYLYFKHPKYDGPADAKQQSDFINSKVVTQHQRDGESQQRFDEPEKYYQTHFVSPNAWLEVLKRHPKLRLCLAHFCGITDVSKEWHQQILPMLKDPTYPNLYVDISSSFTYDEFKELFRDHLLSDDIRKKILFGTDWYMTLMRLGSAMDFKKYCEKAKAFIDSIDKDLWAQLTQVNPCEFYRLEARIETIGENLINKKKKPAVLKSSTKKPSTEPTWKQGDPEEITQRAERIKTAAVCAREGLLKAGGGAS